MLTRLRLVNFQKHEDRTFDLGHGVTIFTGKTEAGKSSAIRALGLILLNRASDAYLRHGKKVLEVELAVDGHTVTRTKGKRKNEYTLDGKRFAAFGNKVPDEIADLLNVGPDNFQFQLDSPYWFADTGGQVSKRLNQIVNLTAIDDAVALVVKEVNQARGEVGLTQERLKEAEGEYADTLWAVEFAADAERLERTRTAYGAKSHTIACAAKLISDGARHVFARDRAACAIVDASAALSVGRKWRDLARQTAGLGKLLAEGERLTVLVGEDKPDLRPVIAVRAKGDRVSERQADLEALIDSLESLERKLWQTNKALAASKTRLNSRPSVCPTCGQKVRHRKPCTRSSPATSTYDPPPRSPARRKGPTGGTRSRATI